MPNPAWGFSSIKHHLIYQGEALQALWDGAELAETFLPPQTKISPATGCTHTIVLLRVLQQNLENNYHTRGKTWLALGISCSSADSLGRCCHPCPSQCCGRVPAKIHSWLSLMWEDTQGHSCLWLPLPWGDVSLQIRMEISEDGIILRLAMCLDCPGRKPSPFTPVCAGGPPQEGPILSLDSLWPGKFSISAAGAQLAPANAGCQKPHKEEFWPGPLCLKTHTQSQILPLTQLWNLEDWQIWPWKQPWLIKNEDTPEPSIEVRRHFCWMSYPFLHPKWFCITGLKGKKITHFLSVYH